MMSKIHIYIIFFFLIFAGMRVDAQNVAFFSSKQGLSNTAIRSIHEDSRHSIWITTTNGLNRYDGMKMNVYRHNDKDESSLLSDESTCVTEYNRDIMLVGTEAGMQVYDYATDRFTKVPFIYSSGDTINGRVVSIDKVADGQFVVCFAGYGCGELKKNSDGGFVLHYTSKYATGDDNCDPTKFLKDKNGLWLINRHQQVYRQLKKGFKAYPEVQKAIKMCVSGTGKLYVATTSNGLYVYDISADRFVQVASGNQCGLISSISRWGETNLFLSTDGGGLRVFHERSGEVTQSTIQINDFNLATSNVKDALCDSHQNVWVGVYWKGVMMKSSSKSAFDYVGRHSITKNSIGTNSVSAIASAGKDGMWVATDNNGLYLLSADGTASTHWSSESHPGIPTTFTALCSTTNVPLVGTEVVDASTPVLLGSFFDGLWKMDNGRLSCLNNDINQVFDIKPAGDGHYWVATVGQGVFDYDLGSNTYINYGGDYDKDKQSAIGGNRYVNCITVDRKNLFIGTADGLTLCQVGKDRKLVFVKKVFSGVAVLQIAVQGDLIWAATTRGLARIKNFDVKMYTIEDGLPNNCLKSILVHAGRLWIGSDMGLCSFDPRTEKFTNYFAEDGLQDNEFSRAVAMEVDNHLYFGGISGLSYFNVEHMEALRKEAGEIRVKLIDFSLSNDVIHVGDLSDGYEILQGVLDDKPEVNLGYKDNHFAIDLLAEGITNQHIIYEYNINGGEWMNQGDNVNRIVFDNLEPGTYNIKVRARLMEHVSPERDLLIIIHSPWYLSIWAKIVYFLLFLLICGAVFEYWKNRHQALKVLRQHKQEEEINEARIQFFMNISHEIRTPMTLILAPLQKLRMMDDDEEHQRNYNLIYQNSQRILRLINQLMDVRKIEKGQFKLDYTKVQLVPFIQSLYDLFADSAKRRDISFSFKYPEEGLEAYVDAHSLDKIVMNLLSNAFKFTPDGGSISINLTKCEASGEETVNGQSETFRIDVTDTGVGVSDEDKKKVFQRFYSAKHQNGYIGTGIGLNLAYLLVKLHEGDIYVSDNPEGPGSKFTVQLPIANDKADKVKEAEMYGVADVQHTLADMETEHASEVLPVMPIEGNTSAHSMRHKNVLVVDDETSIRQYIHSELSNDFAIKECSNGQEAWDYLLANPDKVDLVISDVMMPVMEGTMLCQNIKSNYNTNHIPVILLTAKSTDAERIAGLSNGADSYLTKPFNVEVLRSTAISLLMSRNLIFGKANTEKNKEEGLNKIEIESADEQFMRRLMKVVNENMDNPELSVEVIADEVGISRVHFYRKMKELTGQSPRDFLRSVRLQEAARLLASKKIDITGVATATGFKTLSTFSTSFKEMFGKTPTEYMKAKAEENNKA